MSIPKEAFQDIYNELKHRPLLRNNYRLLSGAGRSQAFGVTNKRSMPVDYSRQNWLRPKLYKHLLDFGAQYVTIPWNAITVNQNYRAGKHYDRNNLGNSFLVAFGEYSGGKLIIHEGDLSGSHDVAYKPIVGDFSKMLHSVEEFDGERFSLVYYLFAKKGVVPSLPPPSVREENGEFYFYRGEQKITKKEGLPHHLRGRKKKAVLENQTTV